MASRAVAIAAGLAAALTLGLMAAGLVPLVWHARLRGLPAQDVAALRFTLVQAGLSALASCALAIPLARALFRRRFWGRRALIMVLSAPFVLPTLAAVMGLLALFGPAGPMERVAGFLGFPAFSIFGLGGVVLAHVFLNLPLATRFMLQGWASIPAERFRLADSLSMGWAAQFRHLEWPMLRAILPSAFAAIFLVCLTSFAVALILGGGPRASTIELGIYQSLRFSFDLDRAARLAMVQVALGVLTVGLAALIWRAPGHGAGMDRVLPIYPPAGWRRLVDWAVIALMSAFLIVPMLAVMAKGVPGLADVPPQIWPAAARSAVIALAAAVLASGAALALALARAEGAGMWPEFVATLPLGLSSLALATGVFLALLPWTTPQHWALACAIALNAAIALPFVFRLLLPACREIEANYARLSAQLGLKGWAKLRYVVLPRLRRPLGFGAGLAAAMAMGDFGVMALFGAESAPVLPVVIARLMGAYQMQAAAGATLVLAGLSFAVFWAFDTLGAGDADL